MKLGEEGLVVRAGASSSESRTEEEPVAVRLSIHHRNREEEEDEDEDEEEEEEEEEAEDEEEEEEEEQEGEEEEEEGAAASSSARGTVSHPPTPPRTSPGHLLLLLLLLHLLLHRHNHHHHHHHRRCFKMKIDTSLTMPLLPEALSQAGLQFAVATEEDFDEIMGMSQDIYGGLDYLPTRYTSWLQETNRTVILARKQGKVIALESVCVIDNGETMLVEGLRVAPQERGKGVAGVLLRFCSELVKSKYPEVKVTRLTRDDQLGPKDFQKYRIITKQGILLVRFKAEDLKFRLSEPGLGGDIQPPLGTSSSPAPVRLDHTAIHRLYLTTDLMQGVLPNATIIQDWQPFKLMPSNMAILLKKEIDWMVDDVSNPTVASLCTFPFRVPIGDDWYYLNIDMFGKDLNLARQQFLCHLQRHTANLKGHVMCQIFLDPPLWKPMADFCNNTLGVELVKEYTEQCVVESDVV